jgi:hypothetical protein
MSTMYKIDHIRGVKSAELVAVVSASGEPRQWGELSIEEKRSLLTRWSKEVEAAAAKQGPEQRLANIRAAASSSDPKKKQAFNLAVNSLRRLGFEIDQIATSGSTVDLDAAMKKFEWAMAERICLKSNLLAVGAIS